MDLITTINLKTTPAPLWLTGIARPFKFRGRFSDAECKIMRKRRRIRVSTWAERHRTITMGKYQGSWRNELTPYLVGIMDAIAFPSVRTSILCAAPQIGKSECVNNFVAWAIDRAPGPVLYVYPDSLTARENSKDRILPMIESSPRLKGYLTGWEDDKTSLRIRLAHMPIYLAWAGSASRLANKPIRYVIFDETDKYPPVANKREADPIALGEKRAITYRYDHKIIKISTPSTENAPIWRALMGNPEAKIQPEAEEVFDYHVPCHACGEYQVMEFEQIRWEKETDDEGKEQHPTPGRMEKESLARYVCIHCQAEWTDHDRDNAVAKGEWRPRNPQPATRNLQQYLEAARPQKIGFHLPAWVSPFVSLSTVAAAFLKTLHGNKTALKDFRNGFQAIPWLDYTREREEDTILSLRDERPRGLVPSDAQWLTAAVDTQDYGFWYEIRGWGPPPDYESWQIREGYVPSDSKRDFTAIERVLFKDAYYDADENSYPVQLVLIDAMGHRTREVYEWSRKFPGRVVPVQGQGGRMKGTHNWSKQDTYPGTNKLIPGGIQLLQLNTGLYKDDLAGRLEISGADPGAWHLHSETSLHWAQQMCAEFVNEKGVWECPNGKDNHAWDVSYYQIAGLDLFVRFWAREEQGAGSGEQGAESRGQRAGRKAPKRQRRW